MVAAILLVGIVVFSAVYALFQTKSGFAVLTSPPPGIPGPYYVTAEAKIYGPIVDLAAIKSKTGGTYASDYTYVQWGTNPFYRVYVDNTFQEVYYGQMVDVLDQFSWNFALENNAKNTYNVLVNNGAIDPTSILSQISYNGNVPGVFVSFTWKDSTGGFYQYYYLNITTTAPCFAEGHVYAAYWYAGGGLELLINGTRLFYIGYGTGIDAKVSNASSSVGLLSFTIIVNLCYEWWKYTDVACAGVTLYFANVTSWEAAPSNPTIYSVQDGCPGTGFVSKSVLPSSPKVGSTLTILDGFDPPAANNVNLTDLFPNTFGWIGGQVALEKYRVRVGLVASASVSVTPTPAGSNMKIQVNYDQAPSILESLLSDEYIHMSYTITAPITSGEYTLPSASMVYSIPLPQT
jgi:hypothetical protein